MSPLLSWIAFGLMCCFKVSTCTDHDASKCYAIIGSVNMYINGR